MPFLDIQAQHREFAPEIEGTVHEILTTGAYVLGKYNRLLEAAVAELHGVRHGIAVNSGTDALRIMLDAAGIGPGDEVITTAFTFVASVETIVQVGATPVFADILPGTFDIDPADVESKITPSTKAVMPVHLFGQLCDVDALRSICERHDLIMLEDAAQAIGSHSHGRHAGTFGLSAGISFYVTKNLGAAGDGGMVITDSDEVDEIARSIRVHGMGRERYYYDHVGYTSRLDEIQAAILYIKLQGLNRWNARRAELAAIYSDLLRGSGVTVPAVRDGNNHTYHQYTVRSTRRDALQSFLKDRQIDSMIYYPVPIHFHAPYQVFGAGEGSLPETERAAREVLSLPVHPHLTDEQVRHVAESVLAFCEQVEGASA